MNDDASRDRVLIRRAEERDAPGIRDLFREVYGADYPYAEFYDEEPLKKIIYSDDTVMLVATDREDGTVVGSASLMLEFGAYTDLVGEFGRLVVHPDQQHRGIGGLLMEERVKIAKGRLHLGLVEARVTHCYSQQNAEAHGFVPVGFLPLKLEFGRRESAALLARYFDGALALRKNNPRLIPEAHPLAERVANSLSLPLDMIVDEQSMSYPYGEGLQVEDLTTRGYATLLRIERGRIAHREIFGPMRLHYGFFRLRARRSSYLIARDGDSIAGALGFTQDDIEHTVRVFELIPPREDAIRFLIDELCQRCQNEWRTAYAEIDVSGQAPRMQRTLLEMGFSPVAYVPALAFHDVERIDVVKMARVFVEPRRERPDLTPDVATIHALVISDLASPGTSPEVKAALQGAVLFNGMSDEQIGLVASACEITEFNPRDRLFSEGDAAEEVHVVLSGEVEVRMGKPARVVGSVGPGESLGETSLLLGGRHSASVVATECGEAAVIGHSALLEIIRRRPDIGVIVYRNLSVGMGQKLKSSDLALLRTR